MGDSIYNAKRNTARQFLKDNKNSNFKPTENHKLSDIEKEIKKLRESPVVSTKLHNLEFHAGILRRGITNLADLEKESQIDKNSTLKVAPARTTWRLRSSIMIQRTIPSKYSATSERK